MIKTYKNWLNESQSGSHFLKTYEEVEEWLQCNIRDSSFRNIDCYVIDQDSLVVDLVERTWCKITGGLVDGKIPVRFGKVLWSFEISSRVAKDLVSLEGFPHTCISTVGVQDCKNLKSLDHCPKEIGGISVLGIDRSGVETLEGAFGCKIERISIDGCYDLRTLIYGENCRFNKYDRFKKKSRLYGAYGDGTVINNEGHLKSLYNWVGSKGVDFQTVKGFCDRLYKNDKALYLELASLSKKYAKTIKQKSLFDKADVDLTTAYNNSKTRGDDFY